MIKGNQTQNQTIPANKTSSPQVVPVPKDISRKPSGPQPIQDLFSQFKLDDKGGYITQEFQDFGYRLAITLNDLEHKSLYMRLAKTVDRTLLEKALSFVSDANAKSKAKLFMWKVKELKKKIQ